jgi:hypothetical protein
MRKKGAGGSGQVPFLLAEPPQWSLDARSKGYPRPLPLGEVREEISRCGLAWDKTRLGAP